MNYTDFIRRVIPRPIRNFLRAPFKAIHYGFLSFVFSIRPKGIPMKIRPEWTLYCHPVSYLGFQAYQNHAELQEEIDTFIRYSKKGMVLFDIGSHFGFFTIAALHYGGPTSKVIAVDPSPKITNIFFSNLDLNRCRERTFFLPAAVGSDSQIPMLSSGALGEYMFTTSSEPNRRDAIAIPGVTFSSLAEKFSLFPTHIKMDVEGYEGKILRGEEEYLRKYHPILFLELHSRIMRLHGEDPQEVLIRLKKIGYRFEQNGKPISETEIVKINVCHFACLS